MVAVAARCGCGGLAGGQIQPPLYRPFLVSRPPAPQIHHHVLCTTVVVLRSTVVVVVVVVVVVLVVVVVQAVVPRLYHSFRPMSQAPRRNEFTQSRVLQYHNITDITYVGNF